MAWGAGDIRLGAGDRRVRGGDILRVGGHAQLVSFCLGLLLGLLGLADLRLRLQALIMGDVRVAAKTVSLELALVDRVFGLLQNILRLLDREWVRRAGERRAGPEPVTAA